MSPPRAARHRGAGVTGLSVWDLPLPDGREWWQAAGSPRVEALRGTGMPEAEIGAELARAVTAGLEGLHRDVGFEAAFLGGGLLLQPGLAPALAAWHPPFAVWCAEQPVFVAEPGGRALLGADADAGLVVDVGQTAVKASRGARRRVETRDPSRLPRHLIGQPRGPEPPERRREALAGFVADACAPLLQGCGPVPVVLALPCPLDDALVPGGGTYGVEGDAGLVESILARLDAAAPAGLRAPCLVLNDAELAAETARLRLGDRTRTVCLTLGFGPGAALLGPSRRHARAMSNRSDSISPTARPGA